MTRNQIENREQKETVRHNKEQERIGRESAFGAAAGGAGKAASGIASLLKQANDPSWYNTNAQLVSDTANISYNTPLGRSAKLPSRVDPNKLDITGVPGIMTLNFVAALGISLEQEASAANIAAKKIFAYVRGANAGAKNYEAVDMMLYLLAMDSAYMFYATLLRLYSTIKKTSAYNYYWPEGVVRAMGVDYEDLCGHINDLRGYINVFAQRVSAFNVPDVMSYYKRHMWLCSNYFKDQDIERAQIYQFVPRYLHVYNDEGGRLDPIDYMTGTVNQPSPLTFDQIKKIGNQLLAALVSSEDIGTMSGDILKAYTESNLFKIGNIDENFEIDTIFSQEVLSQINSATIVGTPEDTQTLAFSQDEQGFIFQGKYVATKSKTASFMRGKYRLKKLIPINGVRTYPIFRQYDAGKALEFTDANLPNTNTVIINVYKDQPMTDDTMVAARLSVTGTLKVNSSKIEFAPTACGSELILGADITSLSETGAFQGSAIGATNNWFQTVGGDLTTWITAALWNKFDWAPIIFIDFIYNGTLDSTGKGYSSFDTANFATVYYSQLSNMHEVALESMFGVALIGNTVGVTNSSKGGSTSSGKPSSSNKPNFKGRGKKNGGKGNKGKKNNSSKSNSDKGKSSGKDESIDSGKGSDKGKSDKG